MEAPSSRKKPTPFLRKPLRAIFEEEQLLHPSHTDGNASSSDVGSNGSVGLKRNRNGHSVLSQQNDDGLIDDENVGIELPSKASSHQRSDKLKSNKNDHVNELDVFTIDYSDEEDEVDGDSKPSALEVKSPQSGDISTEHQNEQHEIDEHPHHHAHPHPPRHLTLFSLVSIGVGGTIGSGIFVLNGLIANRYAGPSTCISWAISGMAALLSGCCYAELSGRIPSAGSSYVYAFVSLGELPAFVTAGMLTLEFLLSGSAVARSWGDKVIEWLRVELSVSDKLLNVLQPGYGINPMACLVSIATTVLVLAGVKESKMVTDFFTWVKVFLVIFMTIGGFLLMDSSNLHPFVPPEFGASGVLRGSVSSFFGYLGFDAVCCVAGEAINAEVNLPRSIMITLFIVTTLYVAAAVALVGMQHYTEISPESGFPEAFKARGVEWASQFTAAGEVFTLPVVVLISVVIQPRLQFALANDGLLPPMFGEIDSTGNPRKGALFAGVFMTIFATFIPFSYLDDFVSAGILIAFTVTNSSLVIMRMDSPESHPFLLEKLLAWFNFFSFLTCLALSHGMGSLLGWIMAPLLGLLSILTTVKISKQCPPTSSFGKASADMSHYYSGRKYFSTPLVPYVPCLGMFANYFLISQLSFSGIGLLFIYTVFLVLVYFLYGAHNSVGSTEGWEQRDYSIVEAHENGIASSSDATEQGVMT